KRRYIRITKPMRIESGASWAEFRPYPGTRFETEIDFESPAIGRQNFASDINPEVFRRDIARARTFGFMKDVERLWAAGYALGSSLDNSLVIGDDHRVINIGGLRYPNEFARHKTLDAMGDLALAGARFIGCFRSYRGGHRLNSAALRRLLSDRTAFEVVETTRAGGGRTVEMSAAYAPIYAPWVIGEIGPRKDLQCCWRIIVVGTRVEMKAATKKRKCTTIALPHTMNVVYGCSSPMNEAPKGRNSIMICKRADQPKAPARAAFIALSLFAAPMVLAGCMSEKDIDLSTYVDQTEPADVLYNQALANLNAGRLSEASKKFAAIDRQHPYSEYARKAMVMGAFANYRQGNYDDAIASAKRYLALYPSTEDAAYAQYIIGLSYYRQ